MSSEKPVRDLLKSAPKFIYVLSKTFFTAENTENAEKKLENLCELLRALPKELGRRAVKALEKIILETS